MSRIEDRTRPDPPERHTRGVVGLLVGFAVLLAGVGAWTARGDDEPFERPGIVDEARTAPMIDVAPAGVIARDDVPEGLAFLYRGAETHPRLFAEIPCFCGCAEMLDHRHLLDCFVRSDGLGWEAHASGCGVCLGEATQALDLLEQGVGVEEIVTAVIARWGDPYMQPQE